MLANGTLILLNGRENQFKAVSDIFRAFDKVFGCRLDVYKSEAFSMTPVLLKVIN